LHCFDQGKAGKYTEYTHATGITKEHGQSTLDHGSTGDDDAYHPSELREAIASFVAAIPELTASIVAFATEREWAKYHKPRSLLLALQGELGELAELFQWREDRDGTIGREALDKIGQELADVTIYLLRLADVSAITLSPISGFF